MKSNFLALIIVSVFCHPVMAQNHERIIVNSKDSTSGYYLVVKPLSDQIKGVLVLLDGFKGRPESIFLESMLPHTASANGILTIAAGMGPKLYADSVVVTRLNLIILDVIKRFAVPRDKFVLGGFSAGGTIALRYVQMCKANPSNFPVNPGAVFAIDSPVDIIDLWNFFEKQIEKNFSEVAVQEAKFVSAIMEKEYGSPKTNLDTYKKLTPFYFMQTGEGNERYLKDIPVRVYHDVDITWQLKNRRRSAYEANFLNSSEMILRLLQQKNEAAEFIHGRTGYRSNGMRHTHSWNIVDEIECIQWIKRIFEK